MSPTRGSDVEYSSKLPEDPQEQIKALKAYVLELENARGMQSLEIATLRAALNHLFHRAEDVRKKWADLGDSVGSLNREVCDTVIDFGTSAAPNPGNDVPNEAEVTVVIDYTVHQSAIEDDEEFQIRKVTPPCASNGEHTYRLCPSCWFKEYVRQVGIEEALSNQLSWDGRGSRSCTLTLQGSMVSKYLGNGEYDESFKIKSVHVSSPGEPLIAGRYKHSI